MRYNERELAPVAARKPDFEGRLYYKYSGFREGYKERWFKLKGNLLFYFRVTDYGGVQEKEPIGLYVIENCHVQHEPYSGLPFAFSVIFNNDADRKHYFGCSTQEKCNEWVNALREASYEHLRGKLLLLQAKIIEKTGRDPLAALSYRYGNQSNGSDDEKPITKASSGTIMYL